MASTLSVKHWTYLNAVVTRCDPAVLHLDVSGRMREFAFGVRTRAFIPLVLAAHLQLQPTRILAVQ